MKKGSRFLLTALACGTLLTTGANAMVVNQNVRGGGEVGAYSTTTRGLTDNRLGDLGNSYDTFSRGNTRGMNYRGFTGSRYNNFDRPNIPSVADNYNTPSNLGTAVSTRNSIDGRYGTTGRYSTAARRAGVLDNGYRGGRSYSPTYRNGDLSNTGENYGYYSPRALRNADGMGSRMRATDINRGTHRTMTRRDSADYAARDMTGRTETTHRAAAPARTVREQARPAAVRAHNATAVQPGARAATPRSHANYRAHTDNNTMTHRAANRLGDAMHRYGHNGYDGNYRAGRDGYAHADNFRADTTRTTNRVHDGRINEAGTVAAPRATTHRATHPRATTHRAMRDGYAYGTANFRTDTGRTTNRVHHDGRVHDGRVNESRTIVVAPRAATHRATAPRAAAHRAVTPNRAVAYRNTVTESRNATITFVILLVAIAALLALAIYALMRPRHDRAYSSDSDHANRRR